MQSADTTEQIEQVRLQAASVLEDLAKRAEEFELPEPPPVLRQYHRKLQANEYNVLVVGEAKRGKSTFVNALVGQDILPTDVDVATSQVFKISPSEREGYRLRFEDGSAREISREDLPLYGSQVVADAGSAPTPDQTLRWIEVDTHVRFLPDGVSILDTPGLGALYAGHARITHRFVPEADAVIFVLESGQPVVEDDLRFIEEILDVTRNVFFIQTKIDLFNKEAWQATQHRSHQILAERFKGRLADPRVWPVSSTNLRKAASGEGKAAEAHLIVSRHRELEAALQAFLARVAGWSRAAEAMLAAAQYHSTGRTALSGRLGSVASSSQQRSDLHAVAMQRKQQFESDWGLRGQKLGELKEEIRKIIFVGKQSFSRSVQPGGEIELAQRAKIEQIESLEEANSFAVKMPEEVTAMAIKVWSRVCQEVHDRCAQLLVPLAEAADHVSAPVEPDLSSLSLSDSGLSEDFKHDYATMFRGAIGGGAMLSSVTSIAALAGVSLGMPFFLALPVIAVLVGKGVQSALEGEVKRAQQELNTRLRGMLLRVQKHFFDVDLASGRLGVVDEHFKALERAMNEQIGELVRRKSKEANAEITRLTDAAKLDDKQREAQDKLIRNQLAQWDEIGKATKDTMTSIKALRAVSQPGREG